MNTSGQQFRDDCDGLTAVRKRSRSTVTPCTASGTVFGAGDEDVTEILKDFSNAVNAVTLVRQEFNSRVDGVTTVRHDFPNSVDEFYWSMSRDMGESYVLKLCLKASCAAFPPLD